MITVERDFDLTAFNTFGMRVRCACFVEYDRPEDLDTVYGGGMELPRPFLHIGGGSNLLFTRDYLGTVLHSRIDSVEEQVAGSDVELTVGAGVRFDDVCRMVAGRGLWGLENLSGIPGDTGAAAVQNIGAYGTEIKDAVVKVACYDTLTGNHEEIPVAECCYGYRDSVFKHPGTRGRYVVTSVTLRVSTVASPRLDYGRLSETVTVLEPMAIRDAVIRTRDAKLPDPARIGSAGSFFKNPVVTPEEFGRICDVAEASGMSRDDVPHYPAPEGMVKVPAAWLIDRCGWKGVSRGHAAVWHKQPLVIVNADGEASPSDILALEAAVVQSVNDTFGVMLTPEVDHI